jgi:ProP effector
MPTNTSPPQLSSRAARDAWHAARIDTLLALRQKFPHAFARLSDRQRRPLKIGVHLDIQAAIPDLDPVALGSALRLYVGDVRYHRAVIAGAPRIDLDGNVAGAVTAAEAENAKRAIAGIEAKLAQRRKHQTARVNPTPPAPPKRFSLSDLRAAAASRRSGVSS